MYAGTNDFYGTRIITNSFDDGLNLEFMKNSSFFPSFQIRPVNGKDNFQNGVGLDIFNGAAKNFDINIEKLHKYIKFQMTIKYKKDGKSTYENIPFRKCLTSDYTKRNFKVDKNYQKLINSNKLCPDDTRNDKFTEIWKVKNSYHNKTERISFNIEIIEC